VRRPRDRNRIPVALSAVAALVAIVCWSVYARQAPLPPARETVIANEGANLAATISYPPGKGRFPGVVLVHGSGRMTRSQLDRLKDQLVAGGLAVLAYDKRGVGESTGEYDNVGVRTSPERMPLLVRIGQLRLAHLGDVESALKTFSEVLRANPADPESPRCPASAAP